MGARRHGEGTTGYTNRDKADIVRRVGMFAGLPARHVREIARRADIESYPAGTVLAREGTEGAKLLIVLDGEVSVDIGGEEVAVLRQHDVAGELSLIDGEPRSATLTATSDVDALVLYDTAFRQVLRAVPSMTGRLLRMLAGRLRERGAASPAD